MNTSDLVVLAAGATYGGEDPFWTGIGFTVAFIVVFVGSVWLLTSMILGAKLGYFVTGACLFAVMTLLSLIWFVTALGPRGEAGFIGDLGTDTQWHPAAVGPQLDTVDTRFGAWEVGAYPDGADWLEPESDVYLADLSGNNDLASEISNARPVMDALVMDAVDPIPGIRDDVSHMVQGEISIDPENFSTTDIRMSEIDVGGRDSVIAVGRAVPTGSLESGDLGGAEEGVVTNFLVEPGTEVTAGTPVMEIEANGETIGLEADQDGRLLAFGFRIDDLVKPGVPFATLDITGQPGAPDPVEVSAVRVRGSVRVPAFIYLVVSVALMLLHLVGVSKIEKKARLTQPQIA